MILVSESPVTATKASIFLIFSSSNNSISLPSPLITSVLFSSSASTKDFSRSFSIKVTLKFPLQRFLAVLDPIELPPRIITFLILSCSFPTIGYKLLKL